MDAAVFVFRVLSLSRLLVYIRWLVFEEERKRFVCGCVGVFAGLEVHWLPRELGR